MDRPVLAAARVWSVSAMMCGSLKDCYWRGVFCETFQRRWEQPWWMLVKSSTSAASCHARAGLHVFLRKLWGLQCREWDRVNHPSPNKSWRLLSFPSLFLESHPNPHSIPLENPPCALTVEHRWPIQVFSFPDQPASHLYYVGFAYSSYLGWTNPLPTASFCTFFSHPSPTAEFGRTSGWLRRSLSPLCSESRLNFGKGRGQKEEGRRNPLSLHEVHTCFLFASLFAVLPLHSFPCTLIIPMNVM